MERPSKQKKKKTSSLVDYVRKRDVNNVISLLETGADPNGTEHGLTPLDHLSKWTFQYNNNHYGEPIITEDQIRILEALLAKGAVVTKIRTVDDLFWHWWLDGGCDPDWSDEYWDFKFLLMDNFNQIVSRVNLQNYIPNMAFARSVSCIDQGLLQLFLNNGVVPDKVMQEYFGLGDDLTWLTPFAYELERHETFRYILEGDKTDGENRFLDVFQFLLDKGAQLPPNFKKRLYKEMFRSEKDCDKMISANEELAETVNRWIERCRYSKAKFNDLRKYLEQKRYDQAFELISKERPAFGFLSRIEGSLGKQFLLIRKLLEIEQLSQELMELNLPLEISENIMYRKLVYETCADDPDVWYNYNDNLYLLKLIASKFSIRMEQDETPRSLCQKIALYLVA